MMTIIFFDLSWRFSLRLSFALSSQEVEFHRREKEELERATMELTAEVNKLLCDPKTNFRQQMFPEFFPTREK